MRHSLLAGILGTAFLFGCSYWGSEIITEDEWLLAIVPLDTAERVSMVDVEIQGIFESKFFFPEPHQGEITFLVDTNLIPSLNQYGWWDTMDDPMPMPYRNTNLIPSLNQYGWWENQNAVDLEAELDSSWIKLFNTRDYRTVQTGNMDGLLRIEGMTDTLNFIGNEDLMLSFYYDTLTQMQVPTTRDGRFQVILGTPAAVQMYLVGKK